MKRLLPSLLILIALFPILSPLAPDDDQAGDDIVRISTVKILDLDHLTLEKGTGPSSFVYQFKANDSIKIKCEDCLELMDEKQLDVALRSGGGDPVLLETSQMNTWIPIENPLGKFGLVMTRQEKGDKIMTVGKVEVWRKTPLAPKKLPTSQYTMSDIYNVYIDKLVSDLEGDKYKLKYRLNKNDKVKVSIISATGLTDINLGCWWYREGEDFAPIPAPNNQWFQIPPTADPSAYYIFEFADVKEDEVFDNLYNIKVERIPAPPEYGTVDPDSGNGNDSLLVDEETGLTPEQQILKDLLEEIKKNGESTFECSTFENQMEAIIQPKLNIGASHRSKQCIPITLSPECIAPEEGCSGGCESFWVYWVGSGHRVINTFHLKDDKGKTERGMGLLQAYAEGYIRTGKGKDHNLLGRGIFPQDVGGEDIYYAILNSRDTTEFLNGPFKPEKWLGNGTLTNSPGDFVPLDYGLLQYNPDPEASYSLCLCNDNEISPVPVHFRFQQFLYLPEEVPPGEGEGEGEL